MGLNKLEVRILKTINDSGYSSKKTIINYLTDKLVIPNSLAMDYYTLWFLNYRGDGKYEEITEPNRELTPFINILKRVQSGDLDSADVPDKYYGDKLPECRSTSYVYRRSWNTPCVEFDKNTVWFKLDQETWEMKNFSGLYEEDLWKYYDSQSHYSDYYEEYDRDEFNYFQYNKETIDLIKQIAISAKKGHIVDYIENNQNNLDTEVLAEYLEEMLPDDRFIELRDDYLSEIGYITGQERIKATRKYYEEEIKYPLDRSGNEYEMEIPLDDFIEIMEPHNPFSFSDIIDDEIELQPSVDLENAWYDTGYYNSDSTDHIDELNRHLQNILDNLGEGGLDDYYKTQRQFEEILKNTGLKFKRTHWRGYKEYESKDGRLKLNSGGINLYDKKITFYYDNEKHTVPLDNFVNWAQGSVLNLKYESVRYGKIPLREGKKTITKISIFDFDGTLADTPSKEDGIPIWEAKTGKEYPHKGWYSKRESLDENVFNIKLIQSTVKDYMVEVNNENTLTIMLTGRMPNQADQVENILTKNGVFFEEYHYKERGDTFTSKINTIKKLLSQNPNVSQIEMWEDRENHANGFEEWGQQNGVNIVVNIIS